jgi:hypothetical protein
VADLTPRIGDIEGVGEAFDTQAIMSANEETVKQEKPEQQEQPEKLEQQPEKQEQQPAVEPRKSEDSQSSSDTEEKHTEEEQRPISRDGSDKDTVCPLPS